MTEFPQRVSVVIPTYNRCELLKQTIQTVLQQTIPVHEIIVVDHGSTDGTAAAMAEFPPKVRLFTQKNSGVAVAFNHGMAQATGDWIAFLGSDDFWKPTKLERQFEYLNRHPRCGLVHTAYSEFGSRNRLISPPRRFVSGEYQVEHLLFAKDWICASSAMVRADLPIRFRDWASVSEDIIYHAELLRAGVEFGFVNEPLVEYRIHLGSMNREAGSQGRAASNQLRWIREEFEADPFECERLTRILFDRAFERMFECKWSRRWSDYWEWREWFNRNWPPATPVPESLRERIYPRSAYRLVDVLRKIAGRLGPRASASQGADRG